MTRKEYNRTYYIFNRQKILKRKNKGVRNDKLLLTGEKYHDLTVVSLCEKDKQGKTCYLCKCICGNEHKVRKSYLISGRTKSCGCGKKIANSVNGKKNILHAIASRQNFIGDLNESVWSSIMRHAASRNLTIQITKQFIWDLFIKQNKKCALTGLDLYLDAHHKNRKKITASLDRIDSTKGYIDGNVQWVHKDINKMKNNFPESKFREYCRLITNYENRRTK